MRRYKMNKRVAHWLPNLEAALKADVAEHLWVVGNFNCLTSDSTIYYTDGCGYETCRFLEAFLRKPVDMHVCGTPSDNAVMIWDGTDFYCNVPDYDRLKHSYGRELPMNDFLEEIKKVLDKHHVNRVFVSGYQFTGVKGEKITFILDTYDADAADDLFKVVGDLEDESDYATGCMVSGYFDECDKNVIYEEGKFYAYEKRA